MVCVVVEDSISGIQSAQSAGIGHIIALGSVDQQARLSGLDGVDQVVDNLGNLDLKKVFL
jgi:beta-phosphoglucomutase-like phosphatase (HAD superfamily)